MMAGEPKNPSNIVAALRLLFDNASDAEHGRNELLDGYNAIALPQDYNIHRLEGLALCRDRERGIYTTTQVDDFARCSNEYKDTARTFIDARDWAAATILNFRCDDRQGHCDFAARLKIAPSPEWNALLTLHGAKLSQRALVDFIEDWAHAIPGFNDAQGNSLTSAQAIAAIREVRVQSSKSTVTTAAEMKSERGMLESIEARDADKWPRVMGWACVPALGLPPVTANVRLAVLTSHDTPTISAHIVSFDALKEHVARAFSTLLQSKLETASFAGHFDAGI